MKKKYTLMIAIPLLLLFIGGNLKGQKPDISNISTSPEGPTSSDAVSISADVTVTSGSIDSVFTAWGSASGELTDTIPMSNSNGDTYVTDSDIPAQAEDDTVFYTVTAIDNTPDTTASAENSYVIPIEVADIATLRAGAVGKKYKLTGEAVLTFQQSNRNQKYIEDGTAGILIDDDSGVITTTYNRYDGITGITGETNTYNGVTQFIPTTDPGAATSSGNSVSTPTVTISDINSSVNNYESQLIKLEGVTFADEGGTFSTGTNYDLSDGTNTITFRTNFYDADYIDGTIPYGPQNITVLVAEYKGSAQVTAREEADFTSLSPQISNITMSPEEPTSSDAVTISSDVTDNKTIDTVYLAYGTTSGSFNDTIGMSVSSGDTYTLDSDIPTQSEGTTVYYEVTAIDSDSYTTKTGEKAYKVLPVTVTLPHEEDFESGNLNLNGWSTEIVNGSMNWSVGEFNGDHYAEMSNYDGSNNQTSKTWLFTPGMDLSSNNTAYIGFNNAYSNSGDSISVYISTDYDGVSAPSTATWDTLKPTLSTGSYNDVFSGYMNISEYTGDTAYVAFKYTGTDSDGSTWQIDDISMRLSVEPEISNISINPEDPMSSESVSVSAKITDNGTIDTAYVAYGTAMDNLADTIGMIKSANDTFVTKNDIPAHPDSTTVYYAIGAKDDKANVTTTDTMSYYVFDPVFLALPFKEDFESTSGDYNLVAEDLISWINYTPEGNESWITASYSNNKFAQMGSHGTEEANETWLITPGINQEGISNAVFSFDVKIGYWTHDGLKILISEDFNGEDVSSANWSDVTDKFTIPQQPTDAYGEFKDAGNMDISSYADTVHFAFKYIGNDSYDDERDSTTTYQIDNVYAYDVSRPFIQYFNTIPETPTPNDDVDIEAKIKSVNSNLDTVFTAWGTSSSALDDTIGMSVVGGDTLITDSPISAKQEGSEVYYKVIAVDSDQDTTKSEETHYTVIAYPELTISEIQYTEEEYGTSPDSGQVVITSGIVTGFRVISDSYRHFYIQNNKGKWNGLYVADWSNNNPEIGDSVKITGLIDEYFGFTQITDLKNYEDISSDNELPELDTVDIATAQQEGYESVLTRIEDVIYIDTTHIGGDTYALMYNETSEDTIAMGRDIYNFSLDSLKPYHIQGVIHYTRSNFVIYPRNEDDIEFAGNVLPKITYVTIEPENPVAGDTVQINANITDGNPEDNITATFRYGTSEDNLKNTINFTNKGTGRDTVYGGIIPAHSAGTTVYFEIEASDSDTTSSVKEGQYQVAEETSITGNETLSFEVYPNPSNGQFSIELDSKVDNTYRVAIFNTVGKMVYHKEFENHSVKQTINLTGQNDGIYFLKVSGKNDEKVIKLIKE